jgi:hypothetical protein
MGRLVMSCFLTLLLISPARGTAFSTDNSDLWFAQNEDGWGMETTQRADVMFATLYVYDSQNQPTFFSATLSYSGNNAQGDAVWAGDLYQTHGPWFGAFFNPQQVSYRIGAVDVRDARHRFGLPQLHGGRGDRSKLIRRYTLRYDNYAGSYVGAYKLTQSQCFNSANDGIRRSLGTFSVLSQSSSALTLVANAYQGLTCTYRATIRQFGQFGQSRGAILVLGRTVQGATRSTK